MVKTVCIYSASSTQIDKAYFDDAEELGRLLVEKGIDIVNGAGNMGLMKAVTDSAMQNGGKCIGVIPQFMVEQKWHNSELSELIIVDSMHERKHKMAQMSDGVIALAGGCGTLEELMEIITWKQLGLFLHPIVILNTKGYYNPLLEMLNKAAEERFMRAEHTKIWSVANTPSEAVEQLISTQSWDENVRKFAYI